MPENTEIVSFPFVDQTNDALSIASNPEPDWDEPSTLDSSSSSSGVNVVPPETTQSDNDNKAVGVPLNDAVVYGEIHENLLNKKLSIGLGKNCKDINWQNQEYTVADLIKFLSKFQHGNKDGKCITQGPLAGPRRTTKNAIENHLLMVDIESGISLEDLSEKIEAQNLFAIIYTTHSHGETTTEITEEKVLSWCKSNGQEGSTIELSILKDYLKTEKRLQPEFCNTCLTFNRKLREGGMKYIVTHAPMPRLRAVFVHEKPFDFSSRGGTQIEAISEWKERYERFCDSLDIAYDKSCTDPSRLMYTPRFSNGVDLKNLEHRIVVVAGKTLDIDSIPRANQPSRSNSQNSGISSKIPSKYGITGFMAFLKTAASDFEAADLMLEINPDGLRNDKGDRLEFECPNDDAHSNAGDSSDTGFFVMNASNPDGHGFKMGCMHDSCISASERDRAFYLAKFMKTNELTVTDLLEHCPNLDEETKSRLLEEDGFEEFELNDKNKPYPNQHNIKVAQARLHVSIRYNKFSGRTKILGLEGFGPDLDDAAVTALWLKIDSNFGFRPSYDFFCKVVSDTGRKNSFHPIRKYLSEVEPKWDGKNRIDKFLTTYFGAEDTEFNNAIGPILLVAAVRRVRDPGCKFDEMLVLESAQGKGKSTAFRILAGEDDYFTDSLPLNANGKEVIELTRGSWIVEIADLSGINRAQIENVKAMLSRQVDSARPAYGRLNENVPRQFLIVGTTNDKNYLKDRTGNRRFWPVEVNKVADINLVALKKDVDQLWAEAAQRESKGASIRLDQKLWTEAAEIQEERRITNPYQDPLADELANKTGKVPSKDLYDFLNIPMSGRHQNVMDDVSQAMKNLGWTKKDIRVEKSILKGFTKGTKEECKKRLVCKFCDFKKQKHIVDAGNSNLDINYDIVERVRNQTQL